MRRVVAASVRRAVPAVAVCAMPHLSAPAVAAPPMAARRWAAESPAEYEAQPEREDAVGEAAEVEEQDEAEAFDAVEAALQELHDLSVALERYVKSQNRPLAQQQRDLALMQEWSTSTLRLLTPEITAALVASAARHPRNVSRAPLHRGRNNVSRIQAHLTHNLASTYRHAPFELRAVRSDLPDAMLEQCRAYRDRSTLRSLRFFIGRYRELLAPPVPGFAAALQAALEGAAPAPEPAADPEAAQLE